MGDLGIVPDIAHLAEEACGDVFDLARGPVICTHGGVRAVKDHWRNLSDAQVKAVAGSGGVIGIDAYPGHVVRGEKGTMDDVAAHMEHVAALVGDRHVAARMREGGFRLGGEQSGHVVLWWDGALVGDGLVAGVLAIEAARRRTLSLSACRAEVPRFPQVLENVRVARRIPLEEAPAFLALVKAEEAALAGKGRVVVRYSGTEPLLRIMVEAADDATVKAAVGRLVAEAKRIG